MVDIEANTNQIDTSNNNDENYDHDDIIHQNSENNQINENNENNENDEEQDQNIIEDPIKYLKQIIKKADELILEKKYNDAVDILREGEEIYDVIIIIYKYIYRLNFIYLSLFTLLYILIFIYSSLLY